MVGLLTYLIGAYFAFLVNQWFNYFLYFKDSNRWSWRVILTMAFYYAFVIFSSVNMMTKEAVNSFMPAEKIGQPKSKEIKKWTDGRHWV